MIYIGLLIVMLTILSFALRLFPVHKQLARRLSVIIFILLMMGGIGELIIRDGMFSDLLMVERRYFFCAFSALAFCLFVAVTFSLLIKRKPRQYIHYK